MGILRYEKHQMGRDGLEQNDVMPCNSNSLSKTPETGAAFSDALLANPKFTDSNLKVVVANWGKLPDAIKSGILTIVRGYTDE